MEQTAWTTKQILLAGGAVLTLAASAFLPATWFGITPQEHVIGHTILDLNALQDASRLAEDIDNNGISDWKDVIKKSGFLPEQASSSPEKNKAIQARVNDPNNITTSFSKNAYAIAAYLQQKGITDGETENSLIQQALADEAGKLIPKAYTVEDIKQGADTKATEKTYGNTLATLAIQAIGEGSQYDEVRALKDYQTRKDVKLIGVIRAKYDVVKTLRDKLLAMTVPSSAAIYHATALNRVEAHLTIIDDMSMIESDPLRATIALSNYVSSLERALSALNQMSDYFETQNIVFTAKEPGYVFTSGILGQ